MLEQLKCYHECVQTKAHGGKNECVITDSQIEDHEDIKTELEQSEDHSVVADHVERHSEEFPSIEVTLISLDSHKSTAQYSHPINSS